MDTPAETPDRSKALIIAERIQRMQNFLRGFQSKERYIETFPQRCKTLQGFIDKARVRYDMAKRDLDEAVEKYNSESEAVAKMRVYVVENRPQFDQFSFLMEQQSVELAEKLRAAVDKIDS